MDWRIVLREAGCFDFLLPRAIGAVEKVLHQCPEMSGMLEAGARNDLIDLFLGRMRLLYERSLLRAVLERMDQEGCLPASANDLDLAALRTTAVAVRQTMLDDDGKALRAAIPRAMQYEDAIAANYVSALSELFERLDKTHKRISSQLLGGKPVAHIQRITDSGVDTHRHGRVVLRVVTNAGSFYYKPRPWGLDALFQELVDCWFAGCAVVPTFVRGDGFSFVEQVAPPLLLDEEGLGEYWYHLGALAALFHGVGSRDMTEDNVLCAGTRPAVVDTETLLAGSVVCSAKDCDELRPSAMNSSLLPWPHDQERRSPLTADNANGTCLPRLRGVACTVAGSERIFLEGFAVGYRRLLKARKDIAELLEQARSVPCRKVLLNTRTYVQARAGLFSATALADASQSERVVHWLWSKYDGPPAERRLALARADVAALAEGDIPHYSSQLGGLTLYGADSCSVFDGVLAKSALDVAHDRLAMLSEAELRYELDIIADALGQ